MAWFRRQKKGIQTDTQDKKDTPEGLWHKTPFSLKNWIT